MSAPAKAQQSHYWNVTYTSSGSWSEHNMEGGPYTAATVVPGTWSNTGNGGGAGQNNSVDITASGSVTATATWVPTTGMTPMQDPPPSQVIVKETATAQAAGGDGTGPDVLNDGLGPNGSDTRYVAMDGTSGVITVSDGNMSASTPTASGPPYVGNANAYAHLTFTIVATSVTISLQGVTLSNGSLYVLTGQQVAATLVQPYTVVAGSYAWSTAAGDAFKNYTFTQALGALVQFATTPTDDKKQPSFSFYTRSTEPADVTCHATLQCPDGTLLPVTATLALSSVVPTASADVNGANTPNTPGPFTIPQPPSTPPDPNDGHPYAYGLNHFIEDIIITVPAPFSGGAGAVSQIVTNRRWSYAHNGNNPDIVWYLKAPDGNGGWTMPNDAIDPSPIYPNGDTMQNGNWVASGTAATWTVPTAGGAEDGPAQVFAADGTLDWYFASINDAWQSYVMYKPPAANGTETVWVPLSEVDWGITQTASKSAGVWSVSAVTASAGKAYATTAPPQWTTAAPPLQMMP